MTFFNEDRAAELRALFFETAQELLQALNEQGLELEKNPHDPEVVKAVRRTVHTLKGDSAACGFKELSELAHELEDVLTPEIAKRMDAAVAEVILSAADMFDAMLAAYRGSMQLPAASPLRMMIRKLVEGPAAVAVETYQPRFAWGFEASKSIAAAVNAGKKVFNVAIQIDPNCPMRQASLELLRTVIREAGQVLAMDPGPETPAEQVQSLEIALVSRLKTNGIEKKLHVPAVVSHLTVEPWSATENPAVIPAVAAMPEDDVLGILPAEPALEMKAVEAGHVEAETSAPRKDSSAAPENMLRVDAERIDAVLNLVGELIIGKSMLHQALGEFGKRFPKDALWSRFSDAMAFQARVMNDLQRSVMKIRMVPVEHLFRRFPRVVRDVAKACSKEVEVLVSGQETDLDKSILDALAEPLTHLVRNAVDHGIESSQERVARGKAAKGQIHLRAYHQGNQVVIEISDDGRGIQKQRILARAVERGTVTAEQAERMTDNEVFDLIFESGFSTAEQITAVSGRGVGMDAVRTALEQLKGTVTVESQEGRGSTFLLKVPLTMAIIKALLFRVGERLYAVPLSAVMEISRSHEEDVHRVDDYEVMQLRDQVLTLVRLPGLRRQAGTGKMFVVVIGLADRRFGLVVDQLVGEEELVIKALDDHLVKTEMVSGASILGDGTVVLILNISAIVERVGKTRLTHAGYSDLESAAKPRVAQGSGAVEAHA